MDETRRERNVLSRPADTRVPPARAACRCSASISALVPARGWDTAITVDEPTVQGGRVLDATESIVVIRNSARTTQEVN